jgi:hypothetical protein
MTCAWLAGLAASALGCGGPAFVDAPDAGGYCANNPGLQYCEDFDEYTSLADLTASSTSGWLASTSNGAFALDTSDPVSPPNDLQANIMPAASTTTFPDAVLARSLSDPPVSGGTTSLAFELRLDGAGSLSATTVVVLAAILYGSSLSTREAVVMVLGKGATLAVTYSDAATMLPGSKALSAASATGQWVRYTLEIDFANGTAQLMDDKGDSTGTLSLPQGLVNAPSSVGIALGLSAVNALGGAPTTGAVQVRFDNVTYTSAPKP